LWIPGTDHAALSTNAVVEKKLRKEGKSRFDLGRDAYLTEVRQRVQEHRGHINEQMKALGSSMDRKREQYTMSESLSRSVREAFKFLYDKQKIYQDYYVVNWSPGAQSVVSDIEVEHKEETLKLYYIRYFVDTKKHVLTVATTRPETMFADVAVAVHPDDRRYKKFIGKKVIIPVINKTIPIIGDESVDMTFGTGVLKITPGHSAADFEIAKRHNLPLNVFAFDRDEVFTEVAGELFSGKPVADFLSNVIQYIGDIGNLDHVEEYTSSVPYCERTGCRIQPMASEQRFMNSTAAAEKLLHHLDE
jgi:valyl-tRNA synthetase